VEVVQWALKQCGGRVLKMSPLVGLTGITFYWLYYRYRPIFPDRINNQVYDILILDYVLAYSYYGTILKNSIAVSTAASTS
jgi:hypothetical protein